MSVVPGSRIGKYDVVALIGSGGMGEVYQASDPALRRHVAIKVLAEEFGADAERLRRFEHEARAASSLNHPNIVHIYEIGSYEGLRYIAMELVEGQTLRATLAGGALPTNRLLDTARQVADGLAKAHARGIVHRDLKPENIMVSDEGHVKILDFGLAKFRPESRQVNSELVTLDRLETSEGTVMGTTDYMSPEQTRGREVDFRSDQFALGAILYEMATGKRPFERPSLAETLSAILKDDPISVTLHNPGLPPALVGIIGRCLAKDPLERYDSTRDLARDIRAVSVPDPVARVSTPITPSVGIRRLAVLPLENLSGDLEQEYFADGMTEALIADLAKIRSLKVISRTSSMRYKRSDKPLPRIANELGVDAVLEGSVLSSSGKVRITTQLIRADTDEHLWAESYERPLGDVLALQRQVARAIADEIHATLSPEEEAGLKRTMRIHPEAYRLYLKGNFHLEKGTEPAFRQAVESYKQAVALDPAYAPAHAALAVAYIELGSWASAVAPGAIHAEARAAALKAIECGSTLADAHIALGRVQHLFEWDWAGAEVSFRKGVALNPTATHSLTIYGNYLVSMGRFEESVEVCKLALERDPLSSSAHMQLGWGLEHSGRHDEALKLFHEGLELTQDDFGLNYVLAEYHLLRGRFDEALAHAEKAENALGPEGAPVRLGLLGYIYGRANRSADARRLLKALEKRASMAFVPPNAIAVVHIGLGQKEEALELLEKAYEERDVTLVWLKVRTVYDSLRAHPRFQELLRQMSFPDR